jgi:hypothetical protein
VGGGQAWIVDDTPSGDDERPHEGERAEAAGMRRLGWPRVDTSRPRAEVAADVLAWALGALGHEVQP